MTIAEFFAGQGNFGIAATMLRWEHAYAVEIEPALHDTLRQLYPRIYGDISTFKPNRRTHRADVITVGFPCQDISRANPAGIGVEGSRSGLVFTAIEHLRLLRPKYAVLENVPNLLARGKGFDRILAALAEAGFDAEWCSVTAAEFGAAHIRERVFIVAYPNGQRRSEKQVFAPQFEQDAREKAKRLVNVVAESWGLPSRPQPSDFHRDCFVDDGLPRWLVDTAIKAGGNAVHTSQALYILSHIDQHANS